MHPARLRLPAAGKPADEKRPLRVRWSLDTHTLCVSDLDPAITTQMLQESFQQFGNIVSCRVEYAPPDHTASDVRKNRVTQRGVELAVEGKLPNNLWADPASIESANAEGLADRITFEGWALPRCLDPAHPT